MYISRIAEDGREQPTNEHLRGCADYAQMLGVKYNVSMLARSAALFHDIGKFSSLFVEYLKKSYQYKKRNEKSPNKGSVIHATQGAKFIYEAGLESDKFLLILSKEILALCIAGHHGKLMDGMSADGNTPLLNKLVKDNEELHYDEVIQNFSSEGVLTEDIDDLMDACRDELDQFLKKSKEFKLDPAFMLHLLVKCVYSCVIDSDRYNAYCFEIAKEPELEIEKPPWSDYASRLELSVSGFSLDSQISLIRNDISLKCLAAAERLRGVYQLSVPTGGGKTLSSLRFALNHAEKHSMDRIIYVIPYLSVLEQTAKNIKEALKYGENESFILEHHSNTAVPENDNEAQAYQLFTDRWSQPIIITTMVQFLESIYSEKSRELRKIHNMSNSILIFDEIQALPVKCIHLFNQAINFFYYFGKCSVLLCTATQPLLDKVDRPVKLSINSELISDTTDAFQKMKRTKIIDITNQRGYSMEELRDFILKKLEDAGSCLVILNTKNDAADLFQTVKDYMSENSEKKFKLIHLSTSMCPAHRLDVLEKIKCEMESERILCISTQLIEAGVDISFACVVRAVAGLDSIAQAAGRCNRNGEETNCRDVYIINLADEDLSKLPDIKCGRDVTYRILEKKEEDLLAPHVMDRYYEEYFFKRRNEMDYSTKSSGTLYDLLSRNIKGSEVYGNAVGNRPPALRQAFQTAGELFYVIDQNTTNVIVPYRKGKSFEEGYKKTDAKEKARLIRDMGRYSVSLYSYQMRKLEDENALRLVDDGIYVLNEDYYDLDLGVALEGKQKFLLVEGR